MRLDLTAAPEAAGHARRAVSEFARRHGAVNGMVADIALAVSEAVTNVVLHAYRAGDARGGVVVIADRRGDDLQIAICDEGAGVTPRADSPGLGLGLAVIAKLAHSVEILDRPGGGGEVRMRFHLIA